MVSTLAETELTVTLGDMVQIGNATVTTEDIVTDNGIVHIIDAVLVPSNLSTVDATIIQSQDEYLYSIDMMGRKVNNLLYHQIIFDIYASGKVVKRYISKN